MARGPRLNIPGATYHVFNRGNRKAVIFDDDIDRRRFLRHLVETKEEYGVDVLAGCQMDNHFHLIVLTPNGNLSEFMQQLEGRFAQGCNRRHKRVGHVFGGRFQGVIVENDIHLLTVLIYVFMNPIAAGLVRRLEDWKWSTYPATAGFAPVPGYLSLDWLEVLFPAESRESSQRQLRNLMAQARPVEWYLQQDEPAFGSEAFRKAIRSFIGARLYNVSVPRSYRALSRPSLEELLPATLNSQERGLAMQRAHVVHGYRMAEIARSLAVHPSTVTKILHRIRQARRAG
jgi:REP element-mobilizing transposase RayT